MDASRFQIPILFKNIQNLDKKSKIGPDLVWFGVQIVVTIVIAQPLKDWTIWKTIFKKSRFWMAWLQIPTVVQAVGVNPSLYLQILFYLQRRLHVAGKYWAEELCVKSNFFNLKSGFLS